MKAMLARLPHHPDGRIFRAACGGILDPDKVLKGFKKHVLLQLTERFPSSEDEVGFKDGVIHSFRHYFVSHCANRGLPEQVVKSWLGHKASKMIGWYYHLNWEQSREQMNKIAPVGDASAEWRKKIPQKSAS